MMRIELTIKTDYLPTWRTWEGVREIIQNAKDAEADGFPMSVTHGIGKLSVANEGASLPHQALLLGHTTKLGRFDQIGKFGEGLKLGALALAREGVPVKIFSGSETWTPRLIESERFGCEILAFDIEEADEDAGGVLVEIGIDRPSWEDFKSRFLFLGSTDMAETPSGSILLEPDTQGCVYVKGIFVQRSTELWFGYDLINAELDRDRKMIDSWDLKSRLASVWRSALSEDMELAGQFFDMLSGGATDVEGFSFYNNHGLTSELSMFMAERFERRHGTGAVPVENMEQSRDLGHLGKRGIVVPKPMVAVMLRNYNSVDQYKNTLKEEVTNNWSWSDLSEDEQKVLERSLELLCRSGERWGLANVQVVSFQSDSLKGRFLTDKIMLNRCVLGSVRDALATLVHEAAHSEGGDGSVEHVRRIEDIWSDITVSLLLEIS